MRMTLGIVLHTDYRVVEKCARKREHQEWVCEQTCSIRQLAEGLCWVYTLPTIPGEASPTTGYAEFSVIHLTQKLCVDNQTVKLAWSLSSFCLKHTRSRVGQHLHQAHPITFANKFCRIPLVNLSNFRSWWSGGFFKNIVSRLNGLTCLPNVLSPDKETGVWEVRWLSPDLSTFKL